MSSPDSHAVNLQVNHYLLTSCWSESFFSFGFNSYFILYFHIFNAIQKQTRNVLIWLLLWKQIL